MPPTPVLVNARSTIVSDPSCPASPRTTGPFRCRPLVRRVAEAARWPPSTAAALQCFPHAGVASPAPPPRSPLTLPPLEIRRTFPCGLWGSLPPAWCPLPVTSSPFTHSASATRLPPRGGSPLVLCPGACCSLCQLDCSCASLTGPPVSQFWVAEVSAETQVCGKGPCQGALRLILCTECSQQKLSFFLLLHLLPPGGRYSGGSSLAGLVPSGLAPCPQQ